MIMYDKSKFFDNGSPQLLDNLYSRSWPLWAHVAVTHTNEWCTVARRSFEYPYYSTIEVDTSFKLYNNYVHQEGTLLFSVAHPGFSHHVCRGCTPLQCSETPGRRMHST